MLMSSKEHWYDRKKYVTISFVVQNPKDIREIYKKKGINNNIYLFFSCKDADDNNIYNEIEFYDRVYKSDSREKVFDRTINVLIRKVKENVAWPRLKKDPAKTLITGDWEHEEEDGMAEYEQYGCKSLHQWNNGEPPAMDDLDDLSD
uniref:Si:ch211-131k2.3 n=1 Tax=Sinocyclocheilus anshuiensis TaxID=1608454 RepID=A0A671S863_9TELE